MRKRRKQAPDAPLETIEKVDWDPAWEDGPAVFGEGEGVQEVVSDAAVEGPYPWLKTRNCVCPQ